MSTSPNGHPSSHTPNGKFAKGNRLGRGNPQGRAVELFRTKIIRTIKVEDSIPKLVGVLHEIAIEGTAPVRVRRTDKVTGKRRRVWRHLPVSDKSRLTAIQELLSRAIGKATEFKVIEDHRPTDGSGATDLASLVASFIVLGLPQEMWPPQAREYHAKQVAAKVIEGDGPASPTG